MTDFDGDAVMPLALVRSDGNEDVIDERAARAKKRRGGEPEKRPVPTVQDFITYGAEIMSRSACEAGASSFEERWIAHFEATPAVVAKAWELLDEEENKGNPGHLLWAFLWMKTYQAEKVCAGMCNVHEDTFRDWAWYYVTQLSYLEFELVSFVTMAPSLTFSALILNLASFKTAGPIRG